jgi:hypothetical protein
VDWDFKTVTAADYTIELNISPLMYSNFQAKFYDPSNPITKINQFKLFLKDEF